MGKKSDKKVLLSVGDGPEHIELYTSEDESVVDWSYRPPHGALYLVACLNGASVRLGPFYLICDEVAKRLSSDDSVLP
mgnify:CR=1 FL=1